MCVYAIYIYTHYIYIYIYIYTHYISELYRIISVFELYCWGYNWGCIVNKLIVILKGIPFDPVVAMIRISGWNGVFSPNNEDTKPIFIYGFSRC